LDDVLVAVDDVEGIEDEHDFQILVDLVLVEVVLEGIGSDEDEYLVDLDEDDASSVGEEVHLDAFDSIGLLD
jgi:hypothetical protein